MALSCERHTAFLYDRGGKRQIGALDPLERVKWERKRDDVSTGQVWISTPGKECAQALAMAEAGRVELVVFRGNLRVWEGPVSRITYTGRGVEIEARDVMYYGTRTIMRAEYDNRHPNTSSVLDRVERIMNAELARKEALDPPINVLPHVQYLRSVGSRVYPKDYYDTAALRSAVANATTLPGISAALDGIQSAYGMTLDFGVPAGTAAYGMYWELPRIQDWQLRQYAIAAAAALAKYPAAYLAAANVEGIYFVRNLDMGGAFNPGAAAFDTRIYLDIMDYVRDAGVVFDSEQTIHHELAHLQENTFGADLIRARWLALNPEGFVYGGAWESETRPAGFIRDYARYSFSEDLAEIAGAVLAGSTQDYLAAVVAVDPVVAAKVVLYKEWMAANSAGLIDQEAYYTAIHHGTVVTPGTDGGTDSRTAAWTKAYESTLFNHVDNYAARGGLDYTVIGRSILFFDVHAKIGQTAMVTAADFIGDPVITQYGAELTTYVAMTDGKGNFGAAGGVDPYYGEWEILHQAYDETAPQADPEDIPTVAEMTSQAKRAWKQGHIPPLVVRIPDNTQLNPDGVLQISDLVPGVWIPLSASLPGRTVSQMQKLDSMTVEETASGGEQIKVILSPAYQESFVEE